MYWLRLVYKHVAGGDAVWVGALIRIVLLAVPAGIAVCKGLSSDAVFLT